MTVYSVVKLLQCVGSFPVVFEEKHLGENKFILHKPFLFVSFLQTFFISLSTYLTINSCFFLDEVISFKQKRSVWVSCGLTFLDIIFVSLSIILSILRISKTKNCLEMGVLRLKSVSNQLNAGWPYFLIFSNLLIHCIKAVVITLFFFDNTTPSAVMYVLIKYSTDLMPLAVNCCIMILLFVVEISYEDVNKKIIEMTEDSNKISAEKLKNISENHWSTGDFLVLLNTTIGLNIFLFTSHCFLKLVLTVYNMFSSNSQLNIDSFLAVFDFSKVIFDVLIFTTRADLTVTQRTNTEPLLQILVRNQSMVLTGEIKSEIEFFQKRLESRDIKLTACNFFIFNRGMFYKLILYTINYSIILSQIKVQN